MRRALDRGIAGLMAVLLAFAASSCGPKLVQPAGLVSPYAGERLFAVAPPLNESGTTTIDSLRVAELFTEELEQVQGIRTLPTSRVLAAMRALDIERVASAGDAVALMSALGVDGLIVGSIAAFDPYPPLNMGMSVELMVRDAPTGAWVDPRDVTMSVGTGSASRDASTGGGSARAGQAVAQASGFYDASNHDTLTALAVYAHGRSEPESAFGSDIYLVSRDSFTRFVSFELVSDLLTSERDRLAAAAAAAAARETARAAADTSDRGEGVVK
ncbi:MAG: hypothetical protein KDA22_03315 [Phycisphaerales bacterium]|nr:hypothetical protein [Phycisphaerales bacterium]